MAITKKKASIGGIIVAVVLTGFLIVAAMLTERIEVGTVGVVYNLDGVEEQTLSQGWHMVAPFDKIIAYPTKTKTTNFNEIKIATSDGKNIGVDIAFNFNIDPSKAVDLYNKFGAVSVDAITDTYLRTRLRDASRQVVSKYSVIDIYGEKSSEAQAEIQDVFSKDVEQLGFVIEGLTLGVPQADEKTQQAIDERVKASQELERKKTELAIAKAEAERLRVEAEGQSKANKILSNSLTPVLIEKQMIEKWNGVTPAVTSEAGMMIQLPNTNK